MNIANISTPVVVLKSVGHGGLGILRSLGRLGVSVYVVDGDPGTPAFFSRYCRQKFIWDIDANPPQQTAEYLLHLGQRLGSRSILIPTTDAGAILVAEHAHQLREWYLLPKQSSELVETLCSKKLMYYLATRHAVPTAETLFPQNRNEVLEFLNKVTFPVMLKAIHGRPQWLRSGKTMVIVRSQEELLQEYDRMEDPQEPNLMLQEYIPGGDDTVWMFNGYFNESSECVIGFTGKKIRQCPIHRGVTSLGICLRNEEVARTTRDFMKAISYRGILDIGYRYDARDGRYKVLDINPRIGATFRLFVAENGMDVARALYLDLTSQPIPSGTAHDGRKWLVEDLDVASSIHYHQEGALSSRQWLGSFRGVEETAYFAADDLLPLAPMAARAGKEAGRRVWRRLLSRSAPLSAGTGQTSRLAKT
jgi:predicted ATP-grasp superfamily ATP-dependent carboligase